MLAGREDYARWPKGLHSFSSPPGIGERTVLSQAMKRHFAGDETALCRRRNGTLQASKRHFAAVKSYLCPLVQLAFTSEKQKKIAFSFGFSLGLH